MRTTKGGGRRWPFWRAGCGELAEEEDKEEDEEDDNDDNGRAVFTTQDEKESRSDNK
jgi:hypothetical protein